MSARGSQILLAVSALLLLGSLVMPWAAPVLSIPPGTQVRCAEPVWQAGNVFSGQAVECQFVIQNTGRTAVTIQKLSTSCGCTTVAEEVEGRRIEAGQSLSLPVTWTVSAQPGKQTKSVSVAFAEWDKWSLPLRIEGEVLAGHTLTPQQLTFGTIAPNGEVERSAQLTFTEGAPVQSAERVQCSHKQLQVTLESSEPAPGQRIVVQTIPPLTPGRLTANIYLHSTGESIVLPVSGWVEGSSTKPDETAAAGSTAQKDPASTSGR